MRHAVIVVAVVHITQTKGRVATRQVVVCITEIHIRPNRNIRTVVVSIALVDDLPPQDCRVAECARVVEPVIEALNFNAHWRGGPYRSVPAGVHIIDDGPQLLVAVEFWLPRAVRVLTQRWCAVITRPLNEVGISLRIANISLVDLVKTPLVIESSAIGR